MVLLESITIRVESPTVLPEYLMVRLESLTVLPESLTVRLESPTVGNAYSVLHWSVIQPCPSRPP